MAGTLLAGLLLAGCGGRPDGASSQAQSTAHVLLITIDTLRADRVGAYGYSRASTPALEYGFAHGGLIIALEYGGGWRDDGLDVSEVVAQ